jgi:hypothetical protein
MKEKTEIPLPFFHLEVICHRCRQRSLCVGAVRRGRRSQLMASFCPRMDPSSLILWQTMRYWSKKRMSVWRPIGPSQWYNRNRKKWSRATSSRQDPCHIDLLVSTNCFILLTGFWNWFGVIPRLNPCCCLCGRGGNWQPDLKWLTGMLHFIIRFRADLFCLFGRECWHLAEFVRFLTFSLYIHRKGWNFLRSLLG